MANRGLKDAQEARYLRKLQKDAGYDEEEEEQDKVFKEDVQKAVNTYSKGAATKDLEKQVQYFGYKIEPFNMRQEEQMGEIDEQGYFVFSKKRQNKDAWLQSIDDDAKEGAVDRLRKKIKEQRGFQNVYDVDPQANEQDKQDEQEEQGQQEKQEMSDEAQKEVNFNGKQVKLLLADLLPFDTTVNKYLKQIKKQGDNELYQKILYLCNQYIASTGQHDIFTMKKEDLEEEPSEKEEEEQPLKNWDDEGNQNSDSEENKPLNYAKKDQEQDDDDIF